MAIIPKTSTQMNLVLHLALLTKYMTIIYYWHGNSLMTRGMSRSTCPLRPSPAAQPTGFTSTVLALAPRPAQHHVTSHYRQSRGRQLFIPVKVEIFSPS